MNTIYLLIKELNRNQTCCCQGEVWTETHQAPLSMEFSRQEFWSGLPFPTLGDLPNPGIEPVSLVSPALAGGFFTTSTTWEAHHQLMGMKARPLFLLDFPSSVLNKVAHSSLWSTA